MHAAFVADEIWGDTLEPARVVFVNSNHDVQHLIPGTQFHSSYR